MSSFMNETSGGTSIDQFLDGSFLSGMAVWAALLAVVAFV